MCTRYFMDDAPKWLAEEFAYALSSSLADKYLIQPKGADITWLCGLYRIENGFPTFVVLTKEPCEELRFIHDRMPLILPDDVIDEWLKPDTNPDELLSYAVNDMIYEKASLPPLSQSV